MSTSPTSRSRRDRGSVTAFVVGLMLVFVASAGLALDSGRVVGAHIHVADVTENAARLAAQEIKGIRAGVWVIDPARARAAAHALLASEGLDGHVAVRPRRVTVSVTLSVQPTLLRFIGVTPRRVTATRTVEPQVPS